MTGEDLTGLKFEDVSKETMMLCNPLRQKGWNRKQPNNPRVKKSPCLQFANSGLLPLGSPSQPSSFRMLAKMDDAKRSCGRGTGAHHQDGMMRRFNIRITWIWPWLDIITTLLPDASIV